MPQNTGAKTSFGDRTRYAAAVFQLAAHCTPGGVLSANITSKPLLIVDFEDTGHHPLHVRHLVRYGLRGGYKTIRFLLPRKLRDAVALQLSAEEAAFFFARVSALEEDAAFIRAQKLTSKEGLVVWILVESLNYRERGKSRLLFLHLETVLYPLALSPLPRFDVSGLMFRPTFHYWQDGLLVKGKYSRLIFAVKYLVARMCAFRSGFERIYLMDPLAHEYAVTQWGSKKFYFVADPLGPETGELRPLAKDGPIAERPLTLLIAGALSPRKGIHSVVDALSRASEATRRGVKVHMVGRPDKGQENYVAHNAERLRAIGVKTLTDLRFVGDDEMDRCMSHSHIVLVPYVDFTGSSGILIRAAHFGKPVLSTDRGLLGRLVANHHLGIAIDTSDPAIFALHLDQIVTTGHVNGFVPESARRFADSSDPVIFACALLSP